MFRDNYSNFGYFSALPADVYSTDTDGNTIDLQGYGAATIVVNTHSLASAGAMDAADYWQLILEHGLPSDAGVSAWSKVPASLMIHSVVGNDGAYSGNSDGVFQSLASATDASDAIFAVGYRGDHQHRYLRVVLSNIDAASAMWAEATAILGEPANWPVNDPA